MGERKAMVSWKSGSTFCKEEKERRETAARERAARQVRTRKAFLLTVAREKVKKKRVKTCTGDCTRKLIPKIIDGEKGEGFNTTSFL